jgi:hypothetical protein
MPLFVGSKSPRVPDITPPHFGSLGHCPRATSPTRAHSPGPAAGGTLTYKKSSHARLAHAQLLNIYFVITFYIYIAATDQEQPSLTALQALILDQRAWKRLGGARTRGREPADDPPSPRITRAEASRESQESSHRLSREDAQDLRETRTQRAGWTAGRRTRATNTAQATGYAAGLERAGYAAGRCPCLKAHGQCHFTRARRIYHRVRA